jgi:hypothetical protein
MPAATVAPVPAVAVTPVAAPTTPPPPVIQPVGFKQESKHTFRAERFAKKNGCVSQVAAMTLQKSDGETFTIT